MKTSNDNVWTRLICRGKPLSTDFILTYVNPVDYTALSIILTMKLPLNHISLVASFSIIKCFCFG